MLIMISSSLLNNGQGEMHMPNDIKNKGSDNTIDGSDGSDDKIMMEINKQV
jgi:hypothetical protein